MAVEFQKRWKLGLDTADNEFINHIILTIYYNGENYYINAPLELRSNNLDILRASFQITAINAATEFEKIFSKYFAQLGKLFTTYPQHLWCYGYIQKSRNSFL